MPAVPIRVDAFAELRLAVDVDDAELRLPVDGVVHEHRWEDLPNTGLSCRCGVRWPGAPLPEPAFVEHAAQRDWRQG